MLNVPEVLHHTPQRWLRPAAFGATMLFLAIVLVGLIGRAAAYQSARETSAYEAIPTVDVIVAAPTSTSQSLVLPGVLRPFYDAQIHARVSGYVHRWYQDIGARVKAGQLLADIDTPELDQDLARARANLATARSNQALAQKSAARWTSLLAADAVSRQEAEERQADFDARTSLVKAAEAEVRRIEALEAFKRITAPFDGVVTSRTADIGALISAGTPTDPGLFTIADDHNLRLYVRAPQNYSARFKVGETVNFTVPEHAGQTFTAQISSMSHAVSDESGTMLIELQVNNAARDLNSGDYAQVRFEIPSEAGVTTVPASALMFRHSGMSVAILGAGNRVIIKPVLIARDLGVSVELAQGVTGSDRVIDSPPDSLADGDVVRVAAKTTIRG